MKALYSCEEGDRASLKVPLQIKFEYLPRMPASVLTPAEADLKCSSLGVQSLLVKMNDFMGTAHVPDRLAGLERLLKWCLDENEDLGYVYAMLHPRWHMLSPSTTSSSSSTSSTPSSDPAESILEDLKKRKLLDRLLRRTAMASDGKVVANPKIPPRRLWDLYANRVVPLWVASVSTPAPSSKTKRENRFLAVSHAWMKEEERENIGTSVNGHEWPVPFPKGMDLERVRVELLNIAHLQAFSDADAPVHLAWLDVVCLRQYGSLDPEKSEEREKARKEEWKIDVPTIGAVYYHAAKVVVYYSGLGIPFEEVGDLGSERHWLNRAWTLQETLPNRIVGGLAASSPHLPSLESQPPPSESGALREMWKRMKVASMTHDSSQVFRVLEAMRRRSAVNETDKVAGLNYYFAQNMPLPSYILGEDAEDAWKRLLAASKAKHRADLFYLYPEGGPRGGWAPSWKQITDVGNGVLPRRKSVGQQLSCDPSGTAFTVCGPRVDMGFIDGLSSLRDDDRARRFGTLSIENASEGKVYCAQVEADHDNLIEDGWYTLVGGGSGRNCLHWVVGRVNDNNEFAKISVVIVGNECDVQVLRELADKEVTTILV